MTVTIIIPARNEEKNIGRTLLSLLEQKLKPSMIVVVLDRCTDNTEKIVDDIAKGNNSVLKIVKNNTKYEGTFMKGLIIAETINLALENLKTLSEFVMIANGDSVYSNDYLEEAVSILREDKNCGMVGYSHYKTISGSGYVFRASLLEKLGGRIRECAAEDTYFQFSTLSLGYSIKNLKIAKVTLLRERGAGTVTDRLRYSFAKGYASYTLGYSVWYEVVRSFYWIAKGEFSSIAILFGFIYAKLKRVERMDIASTDFVKKWQKSRLRSVLSKY